MLLSNLKIKLPTPLHPKQFVLSHIFFLNQDLTFFFCVFVITVLCFVYTVYCELTNHVHSTSTIRLLSIITKLIPKEFTPFIFTIPKTQTIRRINSTCRLSIAIQAIRPRHYMHAHMTQNNRDPNCILTYKADIVVYIYICRVVTQAILK